MNFRWLFLLLFSGLITACGQTETLVEEKPLGPPNIILIFTDDHGYSDLGIMGLKDDVRTPHIDALARRGVIMKQGYVAAPTCTPSRAALLTGRYQQTMQIETQIDITVRKGQAGFAQADTIAELLQSEGYKTGMAGKWHLGEPTLIDRHGFDLFFEAMGDKKTHLNFAPEDYGLTPEQLTRDGYHLDQGALVAESFIRKNKDEPLFFYWAPRAPHVPLDADQNYLDRFPEASGRRQQALAMISAIDDGVGKIVGALKDTGTLDNTLIFFVSDNGAPLRITKREDGPSYSGWDGSLNDPLTGEKSLLMEGGIRVPFIVSWPAKIPVAQQYDKPVITLDVLPTVMNAVGVDVDPALPGKNLIPYLTGKNFSSPHDILFWKFDGQMAVRKDNWKLIRFAARSYLYDIEKDRAESRNLIDQHPEMVEELHNHLNTWADNLPSPALSKSGRGIYRTSVFYSYYLDGKKDIELGLIYADWNSKLSPQEIVKKERENLLKQQQE